MKDGTATNAVDSYAVNHIGSPPVDPNTDGTREEAESVGLDGRVTQPPNIDAEAASVLLWQKSYRDLRQFKLVFEAEQYHRGISKMVEHYNSLSLWKQRFSPGRLMLDPD